MMKHNREFNNHPRGMTMIELVVALMILSLAITAFFPLHLMIAKNIKSNHLKQTASVLVNQEIEKLLSTAWSYQFDNLSTTPEPPVTVTIGGDVYTIQRTISWVDDPEDGTFDPGAAPNPDPIPFDYKSATVTVSARDPFSRRLKVFATAQTKLVKEGAESPYCGAVVTVTRPWEGTPIPGATVTLQNPSGSFSGVSNDEGKAIIPVTLPADTDQALFSVSATAGAMMMDPSPPHNNQLTLYNTRSNGITIDMEDPCSINLRFNDSHRGGSVVISNSDMWPVAGNKTESIFPGQTLISFDSLWPQGLDAAGNGPGGNYDIQLQLTAWQENFDTGIGSFTPYQPTQTILAGTTTHNIWGWTAGQWNARTGNVSFAPGDSYYGLGENSLISDTGAINLAPYSPHQLAYDPAGGIRFSCKKYAIGGSAPNDFPLIRKSADPAGGVWHNLIDRQTYESASDPVTVNLNTSTDATSSFALRFESSGDMTGDGYTIDDLQIDCFYKQTREFTSPGSTLNIVVTANSP